MSKTLATGMLEQLRNNIHRIAPALYVEDTWTVEDLDGGNRDLRDVVKLLHRCGAIERIDRRHVQIGQQTQKLTVWQWTDTRLQGKLQEFHDSRETMPCGKAGHEPHIWNEPSVEGLSCKHCVAEGEYPVFDKATIRGLL